MEWHNSLAFAQDQDINDEFAAFREEFLFPQNNGKDVIYLCGNSLGLQPKAVVEEITKQLSSWQQLGVEGWFNGSDPWLQYHRKLAAPIANIVGAKDSEVTVMSSLTVNLHLLLVSFYKPAKKKYKILMEGGAFPSDQYAIESQVRFHGFDPEDAIIEVFPPEGEYTLRTEDIVAAIEANADDLALVLFSGINYYTGQFFDIETITQAAHERGIPAGFDLAHAVGNVNLKLHDWNVDFACWCSYKYMNSGPGGISGIFVHEQHHRDSTLNRFAGWWGYKLNERFKMTQGFVPEAGAEGWQVSTSPILLMASLHASLQLFERAGSVAKLRQKADRLTAYLEYLINGINKDLGTEQYKIITPAQQSARGSQLSIICKSNGKKIFDKLLDQGVIGDWREPDVIRLAPVPLYNTFTDVYHAAEIMKEAASATA
ncbi:kynureninase [Mucilaginibacter ginkgonis]|uniref:Kynureninase n=1 Tax=Mucilaginibacter ginkgonis TaxID=2682091 RepID=A0A6I4HX58_9SPHI|nr:kynureninase [Mucilaginibacter ginkgonis]QQL51424.1 kynureninase [Mucilaginibacter ginkgonis]